MNDRGPKTLQEQEKEKTKPQERRERAAEAREARETSKGVKDYLKSQEREAGRMDDAGAERPVATDAQVRQFKDRSRKIERHRTDNLPETMDPTLRARLREERLDDGRPRVDSGYVLTKHPDTGEITASGLSKLPQGSFELNGNFGHRSGNRVEMRPRYPETDTAIENAWRRRENKPLVDHYGRAVEMDPRQREREKKMNKLLKRWYETYLSSGLTLSEAHRNVSRDALNVLKITLAPLVGMSLSFRI